MGGTILREIQVVRVRGNCVKMIEKIWPGLKAKLPTVLYPCNKSNK